MPIVKWILAIGFIVLSVFYVIWIIKNQKKYSTWAELGLWVILLIEFGATSLSLTEPSTYFGVGILIAFIGRVLIFIKKGK